MTNKLVNERVNIHYYPNLTPVDEVSQITIGDLHGNALKFLFFLIKHEIVACDEEHYISFKEIYQKEANKLTLEDITSMETICEQLIVKNKHKICLIGDELADRGENDYFMLLLFAKLGKESVSIDILLSNHGYTFIECLEKGEKFDSNYPWGNRIFARSMHQMQDLIDAKILNIEEIKDIAKTAYLPNLKLLSYTIDSNNEITLYHHAKIDEEVIAYLAEAMFVDFDASTVKKLSETIDSINHSFQKNWVETNSVYTLPINISSMNIDKSDPILFLMWNRDYDILQNTFLSYTVNHVHGHDSQGPITRGVYCLNNVLGSHPLFNEGIYNVLISDTNNQLKKQFSYESTYVNVFFSNLINNQYITNKSINAYHSPFEEESTENNGMCIIS